MFTGTFDNARFLNAIGGRQGLRDLERFAANAGIQIYPVIRANTFRTMPGLFDSIGRNMLSRIITNTHGYIPWHTMHERVQAGSFVLLSPAYWSGYAARINRNLSAIGVGNISAVDIGGVLFGDYGRRNQTTRVEALGYKDGALIELGNGVGLMLTNPNSYGYAHANVIADLPFRNGGRRVVDYNIPFVQMVLGNYIPYGMPAYNEEPMAWRGFEEYLLKAVESRSGLKLILTRESERSFYPTFESYGFHVLNNMFYMTEYGRHWEHVIGDFYSRYNAFYRQVRGADVAAHTVFGRGSHVIVEYTNGVKVYINYTDRIWETDGMKINPMSFEVI
jgi:hypothetical protein